MQYLLDTNICIATIKQKPVVALSRLQICAPGTVLVSTITVAELRYGADKSRAKEKNHNALDIFLLPLELLDFDERSAIAYGAIRAGLERKGTVIGPLDLLIAAQAVAHQLTLVTNNTREFKRVANIPAMENWLQ